MYFVTGGRKTQSGLYRVRYVGEKTKTSPDNTIKTAMEAHARKARELRQKLESLHGKQDTDVIKHAWPHLDSPDPWIRYAARIAVEHQPTKQWQTTRIEGIATNGCIDRSNGAGTKQSGRAGH